MKLKGLIVAAALVLASAMPTADGIPGQFDLPIALGDGGGSTTAVSVVYVMKLGGN